VLPTLGGGPLTCVSDDGQKSVSFNSSSLFFSHAQALKFAARHCFLFHHLERAKVLCTDPKGAPPFHIERRSQNFDALPLGVTFIVSSMLTHVSIVRSSISLGFPSILAYTSVHLICLNPIIPVVKTDQGHSLCDSRLLFALLWSQNCTETVCHR